MPENEGMMKAYVGRNVTLSISLLALVMTDQSNQQSLPNRIHVSGQALVSKDPQLSLVMRPITDQNGLETRQDETTLLKHRAPRFSLSLFSTR